MKVLQRSVLVVKQKTSERLAQYRLTSLDEKEQRRIYPAHITLPTPVGPRNKKDATGRVGACSPARDMRTASLIAPTTWSCPTTRARNESSIYQPRTISKKTKCSLLEDTYMYETLSLSL